MKLTPEQKQKLEGDCNTPDEYGKPRIKHTIKYPPSSSCCAGWWCIPGMIERLLDKHPSWEYLGWEDSDQGMLNYTERIHRLGVRKSTE